MDLQRLLSYTRRAVDDYAMIEEGDKIAVGMSSSLGAGAGSCSRCSSSRRVTTYADAMPP